MKSAEESCVFSGISADDWLWPEIAVGSSHSKVQPIDA